MCFVVFNERVIYGSLFAFPEICVLRIPTFMKLCALLFAYMGHYHFWCKFCCWILLCMYFINT